MEYLQLRKPQIYKSPTTRKNSSKMISFFPSTNQQKASPPDDTKKSKFSHYQKFMNNVKVKTEKNSQVYLGDSRQEEDSKQQVVFPKGIKVKVIKHQSQEKLSKGYLKGIEVPNPKRQFFSPQNEFFLGKQKPVKVNPCSVQENSYSKSNLHSTRAERKEFFSQAALKKEIQSENNFTVKLRKSLTTFQQAKYQEGFGSENKTARNSANTNDHISNIPDSKSIEPLKKNFSEEKIKVVDVFQEKKQYYKEREEIKLKTIVKCEQSKSGPSLERSMSQSKIVPQRRGQEPVFASILERQDSVYYNHEIENSQLLPSRQRMISTKTPLKGVLQNFAPSNQPSRLNDSKEILINLRHQQQQQQRSTNTNDSNSIIKSLNRDTNQLKMYPSNERELASQYFNESPIITQTDRKANKWSRRQSKVEQVDEYQIPQPKFDDPVKSARPDSVRQEKILDLLLLSTGELKNFFNKEQPNENTRRNTQKKVKIVQSKQRFPGDFFNILNP